MPRLKLDNSLGTWTTLGCLGAIVIGVMVLLLSLLALLGAR
jgi:hypothetical protein